MEASVNDNAYVPAVVTVKSWVTRCQLAAVTDGKVPSGLKGGVKRSV